MKIWNQDSFVEFNFIESQNIQNRRDISCRIEVFGSTFAGEIDSVWFEHENATSFIEDLEALDKFRKGAAELFNMSSGSDASPLEFKIFATDSLGHLAVRATLRKLIYFQNFQDISTVSVVFEIDPGSLSAIVRDFKKLFMI